MRINSLPSLNNAPRYGGRVFGQPSQEVMEVYLEGKSHRNLLTGGIFTLLGGPLSWKALSLGKLDGIVPAVGFLALPLFYYYHGIKASYQLFNLQKK
jgi:hypothetical protein